jgi:hypothetical protein
VLSLKLCANANGTLPSFTATLLHQAGLMFQALTRSNVLLINSIARQVDQNFSEQSAAIVCELEGGDHYRAFAFLSAAASRDPSPVVEFKRLSCGTFGNDLRRTAMDFRRALEDDFDGLFSHVVFAVTDWSPERRFLGPFRDVFT